MTLDFSSTFLTYLVVQLMPGVAQTSSRTLRWRVDMLRQISLTCINNRYYSNTPSLLLNITTQKQAGRSRCGRWCLAEGYRNRDRRSLLWSTLSVGSKMPFHYILISLASSVCDTSLQVRTCCRYSRACATITEITETNTTEMASSYSSLYVHR